MQRNFPNETRRGLILTIFVLGLVTTLVLLPSLFTSKAGVTSGDGLIERTSSQDPSLPNYDIRLEKSQKSIDFLNAARQSARTDASAIADTRDDFARGESELRSRVPSLKVEYNLDINIPEVIAPDVKMGRNFLTEPSQTSRVDTLRSFLGENRSLVGMEVAQVNALSVAADYTNPDGNLSFTHLEQSINGVPVFRGEVKAGFTKKGEIVRVINNLAPGLDYGSLSADFGDPTVAANAAFGHLNLTPGKDEFNVNVSQSDDLKVSFGSSGTTAEKMYFPTEPGVALPAWRVLVYGPVGAYYVIVDAENGAMLWRKNLTEDQTQAATYNVYTNSNSYMQVADSPFPFTPGPVDPTLGAQGAGISRTMVTLIGNEAPYTFNNLGWINDGDNSTIGNNVHAALDRKLPNTGSPANPADLDPDGHAVGVPSRTFNFAFTPGNPNTNTGDAPLPVGQSPSTCLAQANTDLPTSYQNAAVTQLFYISNRYHDELYRLGFTEAARNFQNTNFTGQGLGNDRVAAQAQDCSGTNNANFTTPADGSRPTMQMYIWTGPTPDFDGDLDAEVIIHEYTHGVSNRLHGNSSGLSANMSRGMGEGWGDFYAHAILSEPTDPINSVYGVGGYDTYRGALGASYVGNYYYGIRRFPRAVMAFTGGPSNRPHNPLTFADVDSTQFNINDGAFSRGPFGSSTIDQVHNLGEIWSSTLWEVRAKMITRLGWSEGTRKTLQFVTDGMKLAPIGPTFLQERDAIIAAAQASSPGPGANPDVADIWAGFAIRGMGADAKVTAVGSGGNNTRVVEAFNLPNLVQSPAITISDSTGDNDGFPEPGEQILVNIPITNSTGVDANGTNVQIVGGGNANYGTILNNQTVAQNIAYSIPEGTPCGSSITLTINVTSSLGPTSFTTIVIIGVPQTTFAQNFDGVTAPAFPAGWTATPVSNGINFVNSTLNADTAPNSAYALDPTTIGGGTDLTSPSIPISVSAATVSFRNRFNTEGGWDGGVLEVSINGGPFQDIITAGGQFVQNGYNGSLGAGANNPIANRAAWTGDSGGYITSTVRLPASAAGQNIQLKWRFGADDNTVGPGPNPGWYVDTVLVNGNSACSFMPPSAMARAPFDFDGDNKTDVSIFRPSVGQWWWYRSSVGQAFAAAFGVATDTLIPADYTGDGKDDLGLYRSSTGEWIILRSEDFSFYSFPFGISTDIPTPGDYDGDGKADNAVFRASTNSWYIQKTTGGIDTIVFGGAGDKPVVGDYDGDNKSDVAIFRPSTGEWWIRYSSNGSVIAYQFGSSTDKPVQGRYTADNKTDVAFFRPSTGEWYVLRSENISYYSVPFGASTDIPVPGDYDGDGRYDTAVFRPSEGNWYIDRTTAGFLAQQFGVGSDKPVPNSYVP